MITGHGGSNTNQIRYSPSCFADLRVLSQEDYSHADAVPLLKMLRWSSTVTQVYSENTYQKHNMLFDSQMPLLYLNNPHHHVISVNFPSTIGAGIVSPG
jgi:hypothetical protein